jgi:hypothetical protein
MAGYCTKCGTQFVPGAAFCADCGTPSGASVPGATAAATLTQSTYTAPPPLYPAPKTGNNNATIIWILVGAIIIVLAAAVAYLMINRSGTANPFGGRTATGPAAPATESNGVIGPEVVKYVTGDANIRNIATAEGPDSRIVGRLRPGTQIRGTMHRGLAGTTSWFKLTDGRGYVSAVNLADGPAAPAAPVARAPIPNANYCVVATYQGNLRIRSTPAGRIIGGLPRGARFQAYDTQYDGYGALWVHVQPVDSRYPVGWVSDDHIAC